MTEEMKNAGYTIIERFTVGEQGFALGHNETAPAPYVTWQYRAADPSHFFWGHYAGSKEAAYDDYRGRINAEIEYVAERTPKPPLLPPFCYSLLPSSGELIRIERGCKGYEKTHSSSTNDPAVNRKTADSRNREMGVTRAQEEAMLAGSLFGWQTKAADPRSYDENGQPQRPKKRDELER